MSTDKGAHGYSRANFVPLPDKFLKKREASELKTEVDEIEQCQDPNCQDCYDDCYEDRYQ